MSSKVKIEVIQELAAMRRTPARGLFVPRFESN